MKLTAGQRAVLEILAEHGPLMPVDVAAYVHRELRPSSARSCLRTLVARDLVMDRGAEGDLRGGYDLTDAGLRLLDELEHGR